MGRNLVDTLYNHNLNIIRPGWAFWAQYAVLVNTPFKDFTKIRFSSHPDPQKSMDYIGIHFWFEAGVISLGSSVHLVKENNLNQIRFPKKLEFWMKILKNDTPFS